MLIYLYKLIAMTYLEEEARGDSPFEKNLQGNFQLYTF